MNETSVSVSSPPARQPYEAPRLEMQERFQQLTGVSLPIGSFAPDLEEVLE